MLRLNAPEIWQHMLGGAAVPNPDFPRPSPLSLLQHKGELGGEGFLESIKVLTLA